MVIFFPRNAKDDSEGSLAVESEWEVYHDEAMNNKTVHSLCWEKSAQTGHSGGVGDHICLRQLQRTPIPLWCTPGLLLVKIFPNQKVQFGNSSSNRLGIATLCGYRQHRLKHATGLNKSHDYYNSKCAVGCNSLPTKVVISAQKRELTYELHVDHTAKPSEPGSSPDIHSQPAHQATSFDQSAQFLGSPYMSHHCSTVDTLQKT